MSQVPTQLNPSHLLQSQKRSLEAVISHRLPKSGGMWSNQYAQQVAQHHGRVLLAQLSEDRCDLRLFDHTDAAAQSVPGKHSSEVASDPAASDPLAFFKSMRNADGHIARWMIRMENETSPQSMPMLTLIDRWTIITSADWHCSIGLYSLVKSLREVETLRLFRRIGIFVIGCEEREARACVTNANLLTANLLRAPLEYVGHLARPLSPCSNVLGGFDLTTRQWPDVIQRFKQLSEHRISDEPPALRLTDDYA